MKHEIENTWTLKITTDDAEVRLPLRFKGNLLNVFKQVDFGEEFNEASMIQIASLLIRNIESDDIEKELSKLWSNEQLEALKIWLPEVVKRNASLPEDFNNPVGE